MWFHVARGLMDDHKRCFKGAGFPFGGDFEWYFSDILPVLFGLPS